MDIGVASELARAGLRATPKQVAELYLNACTSLRFPSASTLARQPRKNSLG